MLIPLDASSAIITSDRMRIRYLRNSRPRLVRRVTTAAAGATAGAGRGVDAIDLAFGPSACTRATVSAIVAAQCRHTDVRYPIAEPVRKRWPPWRCPRHY